MASSGVSRRVMRDHNLRLTPLGSPQEMNDQEAVCEVALPDRVAAEAEARPLPLPSWRVVFALALPVLGQQGLNFAVNFSDGYLAGHIGHPAAQAAQTHAHYLAW